MHDHVKQHIDWNYLRVRGEYATDRINYSLAAELPPRARRIHGGFTAPGYHIGTTSACAENTMLQSLIFPRKRNYLRVRGEYDVAKSDLPAEEELPPRARRIPSEVAKLGPKAGTTSACAENTPKPISPKVRFWNYLRVRGEYEPL